MTRQVPLSWRYPDVPRFTYVLRKWLEDAVDNTCSAAQVVVISSNEPLNRIRVKERLEELDVGECSEFVLVELNPEASVVLDTWERGIEGSYRDEFAGPCRCYRNWWNADECEEVEEK